MSLPALFTDFKKDETLVQITIKITEDSGKYIFPVMYLRSMWQNSMNFPFPVFKFRKPVHDFEIIRIERG